MSEDEDIFEEFSFEEEVVVDNKTGRQRKTGRYFIVDKRTGERISNTPEPSLEAAKREARRLLRGRRGPNQLPDEPPPAPEPEPDPKPKQDDTGGIGGFGM